MAIKQAGALKLTEIEDEFEEVFEPDINIHVSQIAIEAGLEQSFKWSEFYGLSSGPRERFSSFSVVAGKNSHTLQWSLNRDDGKDPDASVFVYGQLGESVELEEANLLTPDGFHIDSQNVFQHEGGYNKNWTYRLVLRNDRGEIPSDSRFVEAIPTLPSFDAALQIVRDPQNVGDEASQRIVATIFDLTDEIPFEEGYEVEVYYKANENQDFAQVDPTISRSTAANADNPFTASFPAGDSKANEAKQIILGSLSFELFTRYTVLLFVRWTGQEASARGVIDFAGDRPSIPVLAAVVGSNSLQLSWQHDDKSIKYELYRHSQEANIISNGTLIHTATVDDEGEVVTTYTDEIGYNTGAWYIVKAYTKFDEAQSSPKRADTLTTKPELDGSLSIVRDPDFEGYDKQTLVQASWDLKDDGPDYSEGYDVEFYYRAQESAFADSSMTRQNADNASNPVKGSFSGFGPQVLNLTGVTFEHLTRYTILMVLKWTGQEVSSRAFLEMAGKVPDPARGLSVFAEGNKSLKVSWSDDEKTETYKLYGKSSSGSNLSAEGGTLLKTFTGGSASYEYTENLDYSRTRFYQVISINEYAEDGVLSGVKSGSTMEPALAVSCQATRTGSSMTDVQMTWTVSPADLSGYSISITIGGTAQSGFSATSKSHTFSGAAPDINSTYQVNITLSWGSKSPATSSATVPIYTPLPLPMPTGLSYSGSVVSWSLSNNGNTNSVTDYRIRAQVYNLGDSEPDLGTAVGTWTSNSSSASYPAGVLNRQFMKWATCAYAGTVNGLLGASSPIATKIFAQGKPDSISIENTYSTKNSVSGTLKFTTPASVTGWKINYTSSSGSGVARSGQNPSGDEPFTITGLSAADNVQIQAVAYWYQDATNYSQIANKTVTTLSDYGVTMGKPILSLDGDNLNIQIPNLKFTVSGGTGSYQMEFGISGCTYQSYAAGEAGSFLGRTGELTVDVPKTLNIRLSPKTVLNKLSYTNDHLPHGASISVRVTVVHPTSNATAQSSSETLTLTGNLGHKLVLAPTSSWGPNAVYGDSAMNYHLGGTLTVEGSRTNTVASKVDIDRSPVKIFLNTQSGTFISMSSSNHANITGVTGDFFMDSHAGGDANNKVTPMLSAGAINFYYDSRASRFKNVDEATISGSVTIVEGSTTLFKPVSIPVNVKVKIPRQSPSPRYIETLQYSGSSITIKRRFRYSYYQGTTVENGLRDSSAWKTSSPASIKAFYQIDGGSEQSQWCAIGKEGYYEYAQFTVSGISSKLTFFRYEIYIYLDGRYTKTTVYANYSLWQNSTW